jgi:hypothetical protein
MDVELGYNEEEMKLVKETRKIWKNPNASAGLGGWGLGSLDLSLRSSPGRTVAWQLM